MRRTSRLVLVALNAVGDGRPATRAASFVTRSVFDRWHARHPDWRVVAHADSSGRSADMLEVPAITVAGLTAGPVWLTARPDRNFREYVAQFMDRPVDGALGGSGLRYFRVTADDPDRRATFVLDGRRRAPRHGERSRTAAQAIPVPATDRRDRCR